MYADVSGYVSTRLIREWGFGQAEPQVRLRYCQNLEPDLQYPPSRPARKYNLILQCVLSRHICSMHIYVYTV